MGAGDAEASNSVTNITNQLVKVHNTIEKSIEQNCSISGKQSNVINVINSKLQNATLNQQNVMKNVCALQASFDSTVDNDAQNKVATAIAQHAQATGGGLGGGDGKASNDITNINNISTEIYNKDVLKAVKNCVMQIDQSNIANIINSDVSNTSFTQANDSFASCLQTMEATASLVSKAKAESSTALTQKSEAEGGTLFGASGGSLASLGSSAFPLIISVILSIIIMCFSAFMK